MKTKTLYTLLACLIVSTLVFAQNPNWSVDENDFEYSMTFVSFLNLDGEDLTSTNDQVAAFVGNEIRGVSNLTYVQSEDDYFAYLTVFANTNGETLNFKIYDSQNDVVRDLSTSITYSINDHQGDLFQAISFADPVLSSAANITSFDFQGIFEVSQNTNGQNITFSLNDEEDVTSLTPIYTVSDNAEMFIGSIEQQSGSDALDFTNPVTYRVRSADQTNVQEWTVTVNSVSTNIQYFKKDAVCYEPGAIRVSTSQNNMLTVELLLNDTIIASQNTINGITTFDGLEANNYTVRIGNITKVINVNLRTN